jgi:hypothetical protein
VASGNLLQPNSTVHRGRFYLTDDRHHHVHVKDARDAFRAPFGTFGSGTGQFNAPAALAVD